MSIYLDYNATTPVDSEVQKIIFDTMNVAWANPSCTYEAGQYAKSVVEDSRKMIALMIGAEPKEIIFTSGGTESNNMVIHSAIKFYKSCTSNAEKPHIITTNIEHDSIILPLKVLAERNEIDVTFVAVSTSSGEIDPDEIMAEIRPHTCLVTVMLANNETGVIQPMDVIARKIKSYNKFNKRNILVHTDAAQMIGKSDVNVEFLDVDYLTIVGHKFYGPRIGALFIRSLKPFFPMLYGGGQEGSIRPGTENTCMIAGLGKASELVYNNLEKYASHMLSIRDYLEQKLKETFTKVVFNVSSDVPRLPNTVSVAFDYNINGRDLLRETRDVCASTGAACHSDGNPSKVLIASGISEYLANKTLRLSVGRETSKEDIDAAIQSLNCALQRLTEAM